MSREPVVSAQAIAAAVQAAIMALVAMATSLGWIAVNPEQMGAVERALAALGALAVLVVPQILAAVWARNQVTPVANPRTLDGQDGVIIPLATAQQMGMLGWAVDEDEQGVSRG
jgi:hypothetical protein